MIQRPRTLLPACLCVLIVLVGATRSSASDVSRWIKQLHGSDPLLRDEAGRLLFDLTSRLRQDLDTWTKTYQGYELDSDRKSRFMELLKEESEDAKAAASALGGADAQSSRYAYIFQAFWYNRGRCWWALGDEKWCWAERCGTWPECMQAPTNFSGIWRSWHMNGALCLEQSLRDGKRDGRCTGHHLNGQKQFEWPYLNGELHGTAFRWNDDGSTNSEFHHVHGREDGVQRTWYPPTQGGRKSFESHVKSGKLDGLYTEWNPDGTVRETWKWKDGVPFEGRFPVAATNIISEGPLPIVAVERYENGKRVSVEPVKRPASRRVLDREEE